MSTTAAQPTPASPGTPPTPTIVRSAVLASLDHCTSSIAPFLERYMVAREEEVAAAAALDAFRKARNPEGFLLSVEAHADAEALYATWEGASANAGHVGRVLLIALETIVEGAAEALTSVVGA